MYLHCCFMKPRVPVDVPGLVILQVETAVVPTVVAVETLGITGVHLEQRHQTKLGET